MTHLEKFFAALYVSEVWYSVYVAQTNWQGNSRKLYARARAVVIFDRIINLE